MATDGTTAFRIVIDAPQETIFRELTRTDAPLGAVYNSRLTTKGPLGPGSPMQMRTASGRHVFVHGEVLEYDPPRRFAHTHRFTNFDDPVCEVAYDLRPVAGGVEVTLSVAGLAPDTPTAKEMRRGGDFILKNLRSCAEKGRPTFGARLLYAMFGAMEFVLPKKTLTENWPLERQPQ